MTKKTTQITHWPVTQNEWGVQLTPLTLQQKEVRKQTLASDTK